MGVKRGKDLPLLGGPRQRDPQVRVNDDEDARYGGGDEGEVVDADEGVGAVADDADGGEGDGGGEGAGHGREHSEPALRGRDGSKFISGAAATAAGAGEVCRCRGHVVDHRVGLRVREIRREEEGGPRDEDHAPESDDAR